MTQPTLAVSTLRVAGPEAPVLVVGPSLGASVADLWTATVEQIATDVTVLGWDLPGHGRSAPATGFEIADLAAALVAALDESQVLIQSKTTSQPKRFAYAGDSLGGAVGLQLVLDHPERVSTAILCCTGAVLGTADGWYERARAVRSGGITTLLAATPERWFAPGFADRAPDVAAALLDGLAACDPKSYAAACEALAAFDVGQRLAEVSRPVLAIAGADDAVTPTASLRRIAQDVQHGRLVVLDGVAHLAPAEAPGQVADLIAGELAAAADPLSTAEVRAAGMRVRREVLGDEHVDRAQAGTTDLTRDFQDLITTYAWGSVWTRSGLDRRTRSVVTLTALVAGGHHDELAMHLRAARTNGLTDGEIAEVLLQTAVYCGVPHANAAFAVAQRVLTERNDT